MRTTTANYNTEAAKSIKAPVWVVKFDSINTYFCTGTFGDITSSYKKCIKSLNYSGPQIKPESGLSDFGSVTFDILDKDNVFTNLLHNSPKFLNTETELYYGYQALDIADFSQFPSFYVYNIRLNNDMLTYRIECRSVMYQLFEKTLFTQLATTQLTADLDNGVGDTTVTVEDESDFNSVGTWEGLDDYIIIGNSEICRYTAKTAVGAGSDTFTVARGVLSTNGETRLSHKTGAEVKQVCRIVPYATTDATNCTGKYENPFWSLLWLLTTTAAGTNGDFDQGVLGCGLGIDESFIEVDNIHRMGLEHFVCSGAASTNFMNRCGFWWKQVDKPLEWIQGYFLKPVRGYLYISGNGKLDVNILDAIPNDTAGTIDDDDVISITNINLRYDLAVNQVELKEINPITSEHVFGGAGLQRKCTESVTAVGGSLIHEIKDLFMYRHRTTNGERTIRKLFGTHANPPLEFNVSVLDSSNKFLPGDVVGFSSDYFPDWINEGRGVSGLTCLVLEQTIDNFDCNYKLLAFDALNAVDLYTVNKVTSVTREGMSYEVDVTSAYASMSANDAYDANPDSYDASILRLKIELAPPAAPDNADTWTYVDLKIYTYAASVNQYGRDVRIHYNTSWTSEWTVWLYVYSDSATAVTFNRVRCDWYAGPTVNDRPSYVKMTEVWYIEENYTTEAI